MINSRTSFAQFTSHAKLGASLPLFVIVLLAACSQVPNSQTALADLQVSAGSAEPQESGELPVILPGRPDFHATEPTTVAFAQGNVQFIEFFAYWCSVCKAMAPTVHGLESLYGEQVEFIYLDRDDSATQYLQDILGYIYQPHFFLLDENGKILGEWRGYVEGELLQNALVNALE